VKDGHPINNTLITDTVKLDKSGHIRGSLQLSQRPLAECICRSHHVKVMLTMLSPESNQARSQESLKSEAQPAVQAG